MRTYARLPESGPEGLLVRIWPKRAIWVHLHASTLMALSQAKQMPKSGSNGLPARIWPKRAAGAHVHTSALIAA